MAQKYRSNNRIHAAGDERRATNWAARSKSAGAQVRVPKIFGWYDRAEQHVPTHDPGFDVPCPHCQTRIGRHVERPIKTISLHRPGDARSYYYRVHKDCHEGASEDQIRDIDSRVVDGAH